MVERFARPFPRLVALAERLVYDPWRLRCAARCGKVLFFPDGFTLASMNNEQKATAIALMKAVALLQLKVLLGAARDLAVGPVAIVAAFVDLLLLKVQEPRYFGRVLRFGEHSDAWIDVWSFGRHPDEAQRENVDALLARVEEVVRDPQTGARRARVLKRWAERQVARAKQRAAMQLSARLASTPERTGPPPGDPK